jgi:transglutaminase/protease-like cytokinesis protein 3
MLFRIILISAISWISFINAHAQGYDFAKVDSFAIGIGKADSLSIPELTKLLTQKFPDPVLKTRAIYTWIAHDIAYDCPAYHVEAKRKSKPEDVFRLRKGVCEGYANLFMEMCSYANVQCLTIHGYARNGRVQAGAGGERHAWNAVRIDGEWKMIDVTWAAGGTDKKVKSFTYEFTDAYFFTDPHKFLLTHYPDLEDWKPAKAKLSKQEFANNPAILEGYLFYDISAFSPKKDIIKVKQGETINFSFTSPGTARIYEITVRIGGEKDESVITPQFELKNQTYSFNIKYAKAGTVPLVIFINKSPAFKYELISEMK